MPGNQCPRAPARGALVRLAATSMATVIWTTTAWAANAIVDVAVTAAPDTVSLSRADLNNPNNNLTNYGAIQATVTISQNNVINGLVFTSRAKVVSGTTLTPARFKESVPALACQPNLAGDAVTCAVLQARGGDVFNYVLIYESPTAGQTLQYDWEFTYSQAGSPTSTSSTISASGQALATLTEINSPQQQKKLKTFVPPGGGTFFTGSRSATLADLSTTTLSFPQGLTISTASVEETDGDPGFGGLTNDTLTQNTTTIRIPSASFFSTPISIVLQRDQSTIRTKTQNAADRVPLYYFAETGEPWQPNTTPTSPYPLKNCADIGGVPTNDEAVCVDQRIYVKNNMVGKPKPGGGFYSTDDLNDFVFVLKALQNGIGRW